MRWNTSPGPGQSEHRLLLASLIDSGMCRWSRLPIRVNLRAYGRSSPKDALLFPVRLELEKMRGWAAAAMLSPGKESSELPDETGALTTGVTRVKPTRWGL